MIFGTTDFYPTPPALISRLLEGLHYAELGSVLEPSAGKADLAIGIKRFITGGHDFPNRKGPDIDCIEIDPDLQSIIKGQGFRVVHDDFLTFRTFKRYNTIIANPPFSEGDKHLLKMLDMQKSGGVIRCLINAETLRDPFSNMRKDLARRLSEVGAEIGFIADGFVNAERKTAVKVALVKVNIPHTDDSRSVIFEDLRRAREAEERFSDANPLISNNLIEALVQQYEFEAKAGLALINECHALNRFAITKIADQPQKAILSVCLGYGHQSKVASQNEYIADLRSKYWTALLANSKFTAILTGDLQKSYMAQISELVNFEFSAYNIYGIRAQFNNLAIGGIDKAIIDLFDALSYQNSFYGSEMEKNIHYFNGWKTNEAWKIAPKVIRPRYGIEYYSGGGCHLRYGSAGYSELSDMEKVFAYLDGKALDAADYSETRNIIENAFKSGITRNIETEYFSLTFYRKGTCHIKFKRLDLLHKFNIYGSQKKKWLPPVYGRASYKDMSPEERVVVDSFEGEAEYAKTLARRDHFIVSSPERLLECAA